MINTAPNHKHTYDEQGRMTCCTLEEKIYTEAGAEQLLHKKKTIDSGQDKVQLQAHSSVWKQYLPAIISFVMLLIGIALDNYFKPSFFTNYVRLAWYAIAYLPVGLPVIKEGWEASLKKEFFTEFTLMVLATMGAFAIGQYPEGVAVMLFYAVGELFQKAAVNKAKNNIKALLDVRPSSASVLRNNKYEEIKPEEVEIGETIQIKAGEKIPLDGEMLSEGSSFNTAALTGESKPKSIYKGAQVLAGMLNLDKVIELKVTKKFADSSLARILEMVQNATARKAKTELLIRKFAKIYTPIVFFLAVALVVVPYFVLSNYVFNDWLYRALIFLVISCPCALVISIPLGYFGGIGAASRNGILFKGSNYLELMTKINTVVMDKTGTLTAGVFKVQAIVTNGMDKTDFIKTLAALESKSTHPIAKAIAEYEKNETQTYQATEIEEISGHGLKGNVNGKEVLAGNTKLLKKYNITYDAAIDEIIESIVVVAIGNKYTGYVLIADEVKEDAQEAIRQMHLNGIKQTIMLSGDKNSITQKVAKQIGIDTAFGDLLPENKVQKVEELKQDKTKIIAFVGDGINDAPVLALSDVGIAMGAMGSDAAIETANVVIQTDQPLKIVTAIKIGKATRSIVIQNIILAFAVKAIVLVLGAGGLATMWEAVFADVGVALLAILNAVRIQRMKF
ncbi:MULTISPECIES: heavy metal translocating P-type ATPase [Aquirufa]|jgi:Cd2+/Zn2+-exporting ATPase|uniref:P-type Zn(2+) transporter n=2 Tax=Aquirufa TaxID=2676247 RepID=A0A4Q9BG46_9BACT|nr:MULTISPECIES: heavy metal translocating P-type ATPase [Aquirufa]MCE4217995.1 cadmium-translocating P-type ATPase [Pseudarcicella sp. GAP-15]MCZ2477817.1 cadmium-translocating P-type ATPase [Aquirufa antheringensis]MCZ2484926.1 cadmium-translocating P-type ATPase [Aquirufa antheringensis]MDT8886250.1 heavy metal translocating P-type ATPase [Aquirufa sp. LEPPI-3A]MDU0808582.1 heavy metal translocating P-type ATPase [Aquirufa sp. LEOWEIH-7C]